MAQAPTAREKVQIGGDEEAGTELKLGEFQDSPSLSLSAARVLIDAVVTRRGEEEGRTSIVQEPILVKMREYLDEFARFKEKSKVADLEANLEDNFPELHSFERSQLVSLCCQDAEEAKTLIPSLANKLDDDRLQALLQDINRARAVLE
ncbi:hypothetical protein K402DRAFT_390697 [Aulographum hederae CBS 113979]|uniref:RNA polymerase Rpb4/RPC9 core domain-containing protein n=1 Tax=Aulographum hederae CBS 113979 TaxID=1176131 RepID=A0A6G1H928_9PEZI|nr:hypothetical protein K402DRAFT_390697 [Aulographum hederae CBS 113979]